MSTAIPMADEPNTSSAPPQEEGKVLSYRSPHARSEKTAWMGMVIFLGSWVMMFAPFFFVYGGIRLKEVVWPPVEYPPLPLTLATINTVIVVASSAMLHLALRSFKEGRIRSAQLRLTATTALGLGFLVAQTLSWLQVLDAGLLPSSGGYGASFYGLTWVHAAHVVVGVVALGVLTLKAFAGAYTPARTLPVRLWSMYWHFVGVVWGVLFVTVYLV